MYESPSAELLETFGSDLTVVNAARVSLGKEVSEMTEKDARLIKYLVAHEHVSPFFHPQARFRLKMPIWMAREWYRHTIGFARNEVSRRYVDDPPTFHKPEHFRTRAPNKKQGSNDDVHPEDGFMQSILDEGVRHTLNCYTAMLERNVPPEQARMVLPQNMMTEFIETGSLAAYARLVALRTGADAQAEIRDMAHRVSKLLATKFPVSWPALVRDTMAAASEEPTV